MSCRCLEASLFRWSGEMNGMSGEVARAIGRTVDRSKLLVFGLFGALHRCLAARAIAVASLYGCGGERKESRDGVNWSGR
jgi:hypothetical protein